MGAAVASDGSMAMQCQSCHGNMSQVGKTNRTGWLDEPDCQSCHVGNATANGGKRYASVFTDTNWTVRLPVDSTFATGANTPAAPYSLYRFSKGHGNLQCSACHGSTHAEFPSSHANDNVRNLRVQGHVGMVSQCAACHSDNRDDGGPHGMHAADDNWAENGHTGSNSACENCHGMNGTSTYGRGTELSELKSDRVITTGRYGSKGGWRGYRIGCFTCHNGTSEGSATPWSASIIANVTTNTVSGAPVFVKLSVADGNNPNQLTNRAFLVRAISQPANGTVGITNWNTTNWAAIYFPDPGFVGTNTFTFAAWNTYVDSALYTGTIAVEQGPFSINAKALVPPSYPANWAAPFTVVATPSNIVGAVTFDWTFGDGSARSTNQYPTHSYANPGSYNWSVVSKVQRGQSIAMTTNSGSIMIQAPVALSSVVSGRVITLTWPKTTADALLEHTPTLENGGNWRVCTNAVAVGPGDFSATVPNAGTGFYRLRKL